MNKNLQLYTLGFFLGMPLIALSADERDCDISINGGGFTPCFYTGVSVGMSRFDPDENNSAWQMTDKNDTAMSIYAGYHFTNEWFAELAYADLGSLHANHANPLIGSKGTIDYTVPNIMGGFYLPIRRLFKEFPLEPYVKVGLSAIDNTSTPANLDVTQENNVQLAMGVGYEWRFARHWKFRNAYESYDVDAYLFNVSIAYVFGKDPVSAQAPLKKTTNKAVPQPSGTPATTVASGSGREVAPVVFISNEVCKMFKGKLNGVVFNSDSYELTENAKKALMKSVKALQENPDLKVEVQAYTDNMGLEEENEFLSELRAEEVMKYLVSQGVDAARLSAKGYGEANPIASNNSAYGRAQNRRVELKPTEEANCDK